MSPPIPRFNVLGVGVSALNLEDARERLLGVRAGRETRYVCVTSVHGIIEAGDDPEFRTILNRAWMVTPDGMPLVWMGHTLGFRNITRVYGPDLMSAVCDHGRRQDLRHYLYGGGAGIVDLLKHRLESRYPGIRIVGRYSPPFRALNSEERANLAADLDSTKPDIMWIGMSTPKQERFMAENAPFFEVGAMVGVGAAFDFHAGVKSQAPRFMQRSGLEWLYRLVTEPRRLGPRYLRNNPLFAARLALAAAGLRSYPRY